MTSSRRNAYYVELVERLIELFFFNGLDEIAMGVNLKCIIDDVVIPRDEYNGFCCHIFLSDTF